MRAEQGRETGRARAAVTAVFLINGIGYGTWVARIPSLRDELHLDTQTLGLTLLGVAIGSLVGLPIGVALWIVALLCVGIAVLEGSVDDGEAHKAHEQMPAIG